VKAVLLPALKITVPLSTGKTFVNVSLSIKGVSTVACPKLHTITPQMFLEGVENSSTCYFYKPFPSVGCWPSVTLA
jgi:hypothetical protein